MIEDNDFSGIAVVDYCLAMLGGPFDCCGGSRGDAGLRGRQRGLEQPGGRTTSSRTTGPTRIRPIPFAFTASDLGLLTLGDHGNCYAGNAFATFFSTLGVLPPCP